MKKQQLTIFLNHLNTLSHNFKDLYKSPTGKIQWNHIKAYYTQTNEKEKVKAQPEIEETFPSEEYLSDTE